MVVGIIPARIGSKRFPKKILADINGKPMIAHVAERAMQSKLLEKIVIAIDAEETKQALSDFDFDLVMTSKDHSSGTDRVAQVAKEIDSAEIIINIQGDEPLIKPQDINRLLYLFEEEDIDIGTFIQPISNEDDYLNPNVVKAVPTTFDEGFCDVCYFSRSPIPFMDSFKENMAFKHIGIYGYTATAFEEIKNLEPTILEENERLEQLRWIQNHMVISAIVSENKLHGVDTQADLLAVENILKSPK